MDTEPLILALANDLYRDRDRLMLTKSRLEGAGLTDLCIVAPRRQGWLQGGRFLGLPVVEGVVRECIVAIGYRA